MTDPKMSAIICTHNRDNYLGAAIDSLLVQDFTDFEVLMVDNGSSARTREVVEARLSDPRLQYVFEPVLGLSVALLSNEELYTTELALKRGWQVAYVPVVSESAPPTGWASLDTMPWLLIMWPQSASSAAGS